MKKLIASLTILTTGVALASSVSSASTFGVLKVASTAAETIISVPWVEAGSLESATEANVGIMVKDLVKTSNLTGSDTVANADQLLVYDPTANGGAGAYYGWYLNSSRVWKGCNVPKNDGMEDVYAPDEDHVLKRGESLVLIRQAASLSTENDHDNNIYLYGQYKVPSSVSCTITRAAAAERTTLFAPVNTSSDGISLNSNKLNWTGAVTGDKIKLQGTIPVTFTYELDREAGSRWGRYNSNSQWITTGATILPGQGAWYTTVAGSGDVTVSGF